MENATLENKTEVITPQDLMEAEGSDPNLINESNFGNFGNFGNGPLDPGGYTVKN